MHDAAQSGAPRGTAGGAGGYAWYVLGVFVLVTAFNVADRNILNALLEPIKLEFGVSDTAMGLLVGTSFAVVHIIASLIIARWADRSVRRSIVAGGLFVWSGLTALSGLARGYADLFAARVGVSAAEGCGSAPAHSLLCDYFPLHLRARVMSIFGFGGILGIALGMGLGGTIAELYGWRVAFFVVGLPGALLAILVRLSVREPVRGALDAPGRSEPPPSVSEVARFLLGRRSFVHMVAGAGFHAFASMGASAFYVSYLIRLHGLPVGSAALTYMAVGPMVSIVGTLLGGWLADALGKRDIRWYMWIPALSSLLALPFSVAFVLWPSGSTLSLGTTALLAAPLVLIPGSFFGSMYNGPTLAMTQSIARPSMRSQASAITTGSYNLIGMGLGPLAVGLVNDAFAPSVGADAIRYGLLIVGLVHLQGTLHNWLAARHLAADLEAD
ncbi:MAG: MFS transporter [Proteobacteria bacterium]|nr:MFS transporter [Pseudomonadota bacterium]